MAQKEFCMSQLKTTVTTDPCPGWLNYTAEARRAGYWVGLAYDEIPEELQPHFEHIGVQYWIQNEGSLSINVSMITWFKYSKKPAGEHEQWEEFKRTEEMKISAASFATDTQKDEMVVLLRAGFLDLLQRHILSVEEELKGGVSSLAANRLKVTQAYIS